MEEKVIFKVTRDDKITAVSLCAKSEDDLMALALAIDDIICRTPELATALLAVRVARSNNKDLDKSITDETVEMPDFDKILKDIDHERD